VAPPLPPSLPDVAQPAASSTAQATN